MFWPRPRRGERRSAALGPDVSCKSGIHTVVLARSVPAECMKRARRDACLRWTALPCRFLDGLRRREGGNVKGAEAVVRTLVESGVSTCFANPGTSEMHF